MMAFYANLPYAQAPGMGLNAFFTYTVVFSLGYTWQEALAMVFLCGVISLIITVTKVRKMIMSLFQQPSNLRFQQVSVFSLHMWELKMLVS